MYSPRKGDRPNPILFTLNGLLPHEELEIPCHPGEELMEKMILHRFEALPGLGLSGKGESLERGFGERRARGGSVRELRVVCEDE